MPSVPASARMNAPMCAASHATASSASTAAPDQPMSFSAAVAALPECFTALK
jgi:hypothetical protein